MSNGNTAALGDAKPLGGDTTGRMVRLFVLAVAIMAIAEWIGSVNFNVGPGKVVLDRKSTRLNSSH